jgi:hypothetical protein
MREGLGVRRPHLDRLEVWVVMEDCGWDDVETCLLI